MPDPIRSNAPDATMPACILRYRELVHWSSDVEREIESYRDVVEAEDPNVQDLRELARSARNDGHELLEDGRLLRLGVIGQMKAGKSSLLNSLLFEGREVLPKAATPMTASLTHIVKSDKDEVEIEYYSRSEWDEIRGHANHYRKEYLDPRRARGGEIAASGENVKSSAPPLKPTPSLQASHELVEMVEARGIDVDRYAGERKRQPASLDALNQTLRGLVGTDGWLTPLVKGVTIECSQGIPDLDIVDTPGINDPIVSRSLETRRLLDRSDAVLLLSYAGQFMDREDAMFIQERASAAGIKRRLLLASKFDSALLDVAREHCRDLGSAMDDCRARLAEHAAEALQRTAVDGNEIEMEEEDILFVSSICANLAWKPPSEWTEDDREAFENLRKGYPDWLDPVEDAVNEATKDNLSRIGGRERVVEQLAAIRRDKEAIIKEKMNAFLEGKRCSMTSELEEIVKDLRGRRDELRSGDLAKSKEMLDLLRSIIEDIKDEVERKWGEFVDAQRGRFDKLLDGVREEGEEAKDEVRDAEKLENAKKKKEGIIPWYGRLLGLGGYETYERRVLDKVRLREAVENYAEEVKRRLDDTAESAFLRKDQECVVEELSEAIANSVPNEVASGVSFNLKRTLRHSIDGICRTARKAIQESLPDDTFETDNLDLDEKRDARRVIRQIEKEVTAWLRTVQHRVEEEMERATDILAPISRELESNAKRLEDDHAKGEFQLQRYALALDAIERGIERAPKWSGS